jgi:hypothetical protein
MPFAAKEIPNLTDKDKSRIFSKIAVGEIDQCWLCEGDSQCGGYGHMQISKKKHYMHRLAWSSFFGAIPDGMNILHSCDRPSCCNPTHLSPGTHSDNMKDKTSKGRGVYHFGANHHAVMRPNEMARGEENGSAKLNASQVIQIREERKRGVPRKVIAERYGVSEGCVKAIIGRRTWAHI